MKTIEDIVKKLSLEHAKKIESITTDQFEDALIGAIKSGDFQICLQYDNNLNTRTQGMTYIPFREVNRMKDEVNKLTHILSALGYEEFANDEKFLRESGYYAI
tara:strand:- start:29922 stop:30230 length:309 start_codon:yes stop_codon:yes gene_type:complete